MPSLPPPVVVPPTATLSRFLAQRQAEWLRGGRVRMLRAANIQHCSSILEIGAGWGDVVYELAERSRATVVALDAGPIPSVDTWPADLQATVRQRVQWVQADAGHLPFTPAAFDLIFAQCTWLWLREPERVLQEVQRVLRPGGRVAFIEPDYDGMMEFPREIATRDIWCRALQRAGADPCIGRKLPGWLRQLGMQVDVFLVDRLGEAHGDRHQFLLELELTADERTRVELIMTEERHCNVLPVVHLPFWFVLGRKAGAAN